MRLTTADKLMFATCGVSLVALFGLYVLACGDFIRHSTCDKYSWLIVAFSLSALFVYGVREYRLSQSQA